MKTFMCLRYRFYPDIVKKEFWSYFRFNLSSCDVEVQITPNPFHLISSAKPTAVEHERVFTLGDNFMHNVKAFRHSAVNVINERFEFAVRGLY